MKQISVFIENRQGTLTTILQLLKKGQIQLHAISIADTADYGICRMICNNPEKAVEILKNSGIAAAMADITAIVMENKPGSAADIVSAFAESGINLAYLYTFLLEDKLVLAFRPDNYEKTAEIIEKNHLQTI